MRVLELNCSFKMNTRKKIIPVEISAVQWDKKKKKKRKRQNHLPTCHLFCSAVSSAYPPTLPRSSCRGDSFEGQSQQEWNGPSDEHWLHEHLRWHPLSLLSNYASIIHGNAVCGKLFHQAARRRAATHRAAGARKSDKERRGNDAEIRESWSEKKRLSNKDRERRCEKKGSGKMKRREPEGVSKRRASWYYIASDILCSRRQASTNEQSSKLLRQGRQAHTETGCGCSLANIHIYSGSKCRQIWLLVWNLAHILWRHLDIAASS